MCLATPARLIRREEDEGLVDLHGSRLKVNVQLVPEARNGDWLLLHAGFAIQRLDPEQAKRTWAVLEDLPASQEPGQGDEQ